MYAPPHPGLYSSSSYTAAEQRSFDAYSNCNPNLTRPPLPQPGPYYQSNILPTAPPMFNQGFGDRSGFYRCETNRQGNGQWKKLMMEMKNLQEKKERLEQQHLQGGRSEGLSLQERRLQEEETLLGRRYREEKNRKRGFEGLDYGDQSEGWVNEQRNEKSDWRAEKKLRLEEARELDRMWDMVKRKGKYEGSVPEMRRRNWPEESKMESDLKRAGQEEFGSRRAVDLSEEIEERERELRRREEKLQQDERKLDEISRAEKERNLREREERLRRKEKELEEKSGKSAPCYDNWGSREWSRSSDRSSSSRYDKGRNLRKLNYDHEENQLKLKENEELTLEISIPNQPGDLVKEDDRGPREVSSFSNRSVASKGESGGDSRNIRKVNYDQTILKMERLLREKQESVSAQLARERKNRKRRRNRSRKLPWGTYRMTKSSQNTDSPLKLHSETSSEDEALPRAPVKSRLGVRRGVKERLGRRSKIAKQEMERDLSMVQFEGRVIAELQERPLNLDEDGEDINTFEREEDAWSEEDFYEEEL